jgi:hypothetical protein
MIRLAVAPNEKEDAKKLGAYYDFEIRSWCTSDDNKNKDALLKTFNIERRRLRINVDYEKRILAKNMGAMWDSSHKLWYTLEGNSNNEIIFEKFRRTTTEDKDMEWFEKQQEYARRRRAKRRRKFERY